MTSHDVVAQLRLALSEENGRRSGIRTGYRSQFRFEGQDNDVELTLADCGCLEPGESGTALLRFFAPGLQNRRLSVGAMFHLAEGKVIVATGYIAEIVNTTMLAPRDATPIVIYVDVDDTLIRTAGTKRIPITRTVEYVKKSHCDGKILYCWSRGGAEYARSIATFLGITHCFEGFLPKPDLVVDDQMQETLGYCEFLHPNQVK